MTWLKQLLCSHRKALTYYPEGSWNCVECGKVITEGRVMK